ncbi:hypothetical protein EMCRGX_G001631 [Ephydatia muelleri]
MAVIVSDRLLTVGRGRDREGLMPAIAGRDRDRQGSNPTGVGKSTLVNSILGKDVVKTGGPGCRSQSQPGPFSSLSAVTAGIIRASGDVEGVTVTVYDSPGLQDGHCKDQSYLDQIREVFDQNTPALTIFSPVVAAGDYGEEAKHRELIFVAPGKKHMDYLSELWVQCLKRLPPGISRLAFMQASDLSVAISPNVGTESIRSSIEQLLEVASISSAHPDGTDIRSDLDIIGLSINGTTSTACVDGLTETTPISAHLPVVAVKNMCSIPTSTAVPCTAFRNRNTLSSTSICEEGVSQDPNTALENTTSSSHQATTPVTQGRRTACRSHRRSRRKQAEGPEPIPSTIPSHSLLPGAADRNGTTTGFMATCKQGIASEPSPAASNATSSTNATPIASSDCTVGKYRRHTKNKRALGLEPNTPVGTSGSTKVSSSHRTSKDQVWCNSKCTSVPAGAPTPTIDARHSYSTIPATAVLEMDARDHKRNSYTPTSNTATVRQTSIASHSVQTPRAMTDEVFRGCSLKFKCKPVVSEVSNVAAVKARSTHTSTPMLNIPPTARDHGSTTSSYCNPVVGEEPSAAVINARSTHTSTPINTPSRSEAHESTMPSSYCKLFVGEEPSAAIVNTGYACTSVNTPPKSCGSSNTLTSVIMQESNAAGNINARSTLMMNASSTLSNCQPVSAQVPNTAVSATVSKDCRSNSSSSNCQLTVSPKSNTHTLTSKLDVAPMASILSKDDSQNTILNRSQALPDPSSGQILAGPMRRRRIQLNEEQSRVFVDSTCESLAEIAMQFANIGATGGAAIGTIVVSVAAMFVPALALAGPQTWGIVGAIAGGAIGGTLGAALGLAIGLWKKNEGKHESKAKPL